ncbi:hypothetical protein L0665_00375 [Methanogenium marinum]|uniref:Uncharacterized protein n=1 Tax=Methanogenium marinum TaxID=348610 RepID=A0A9Q4KMA6_9EURY|nr:hypothetical protein [Methanogenium marinum]MDE4907083.1 hypothetical protein [Methanogenium marinum]
MNEFIRRVVMVIGIVTIGTILIFFNASIIITLSATLAFGVIMAMGIGLLKKEDFKRLSNLKIPSIKNIRHKKDSTKSEDKKQKSKKPDSKKDKKTHKTGNILSRFHKNEQNTDKTEKSKTEKSKTEKSKKSEKNGFSAGLSAAIGSFKTSIHKSRDKNHSDKIDSLLKTTIDEPVLSPQDSADNQPELALPDDPDELSDDMDLFDDEDFASLDSLDIEGEETLFDFDGGNSIESQSEEKDDSGTLNMDDEINSILLSENAFDEDEDFSPVYPDGTGSSASQSKDTDNKENPEEEGLFNSDEFFVQGIEDGLDEESFIHLPETPNENQKTSKATLNDSLDELSNITEFEKLNQDEDEFSGFDAINLEELETDDFSLETDEIIIEEEEINDADILPDDFIPSPDIDSTKNEIDQNTGNDNLSDGSGFSNSEMNESMSFSGKNEYDDILSVLKSDIKTTKKAPQTSLVRELKDVHVESKDLVEELELVLHAMGGKSGKTNGQDEESE